MPNRFLHTQLDLKEKEKKNGEQYNFISKSEYLTLLYDDELQADAKLWSGTIAQFQGLLEVERADGAALRRWMLAVTQKIHLVPEIHGIVPLQHYLPVTEQWQG